jgi:hypothetical protein
VRSLHADLTTAQQAASSTPYVALNFASRNRATTRAYTTSDSPNRIQSVTQSEGRSGLTGYLPVSGISFPVTTIIRLLDNDNALIALEWKGYRVDIGWGYNTTSGNKSSSGPRVYVLSERSVSLEGQLYLELYCTSLWGLLAIKWANDDTSAQFEWHVDTSIRHILMELMGGISHPLVSAAIQDNGGVFTDETVDAQDVGANDVALLPAAPAVDDAFYFGLSYAPDHVSIDQTTAGAGTWTMLWEYWNGSTWASLANVVATGNADQFKSSGLNVVQFDLPTNIATTTINSQGPFYYVRARVHAFTSLTTQPQAARIFVDLDFGISLDTSASGQADDYLPQYIAPRSTPVTTVIEDILQHSLLGILLRADHFHIKYIDSTDSVSNVYGTSHIARTIVLEDTLVVPNTVHAINIVPEDTSETSYTDTSTDSTSVAAIGTIATVVVDNAISSIALAKTAADKVIAQLQRDRTQGQVEVPLHCGQEVWDKVEVRDSRSGVTWNGRVSQLVRRYESGIYSLEIDMGGVEFRPVSLGPPAAIAVGDRLEPVFFSHRRQVRETQPISQLPTLTGQILDPVIHATAQPTWSGPSQRGLTPTLDILGQIELHKLRLKQWQERKNQRKLLDDFQALQQHVMRIQEMSND